MTANTKQVGGSHYSQHGALQHWDIVAHFGLDYFQGQITKYVMRWKDKNGLQDLQKAQHFLEKYIEINTERVKQVEQDMIVVPRTHEQSDIVVPEGWSAFRLGSVKPTGWVGFTFEGAQGDTELFTCRRCRAPVRVPVDHNPDLWHDCTPTPR